MPGRGVVVEKIWAFEFKTQREFWSAFLRISEFSSRESKARSYSEADCRASFEARHGKGSLETDWRGLMVRGRLWREFEKHVGKLNAAERRIVDCLPTGKNTCAIIGYATELGYSTQTLKHEMAHAYDYLYPAYARVAREMMRQTPQPNLARELTMSGYRKRELASELHAYLLTGLCEYGHTQDKDRLLIRARLALLFKQHFGYNIRCATMKTLQKHIRHGRM